MVTWLSHNYHMYSLSYVWLVSSSGLSSSASPAIILIIWLLYILLTIITIILITWHTSTCLSLRLVVDDVNRLPLTNNWVGVVTLYNNILIYQWALNRVSSSYIGTGGCGCSISSTNSELHLGHNASYPQREHV